MSSKRKCIVILLFIVLVTILFILYNRSQFFLGISYRCKYSVYQQVHSKSFKNLSNLTVNNATSTTTTVTPPRRPHRLRRKLKTTTTDLPSLRENSLEVQKFFRRYTGLKVPRNITKYKECPEGRVLTVLLTGRLGNIIWEYMSLIAVEELYSDRFNMQAYTPGNMEAILGLLFEGLDTPAIIDLPHSCVSMRNAQLIEGKGVPRHDPRLPYNSPLILDAYSCRYKDIVHYGINKIKQKLRFKNYYVRRASDSLMLIKSRFNFNSTANVTYVGVHYRGADYNVNLNTTYPKRFKGPLSYSYYRNAMQHFNDTFGNVIFIFMSADGEWIKLNVPHMRGFNLVVNPAGNEKNMFHDFVLLSACNHSIINYGTYGAAAALFAGGTTIVYDLNIPEDNRGYSLALSLVSLLSNWHLCDEIKCLVD